MFLLSSWAIRVRVMGILHDLLCAALALPLAVLIRTGEIPSLNSPFWFMVGVLIVTSSICFYLAGLNRGSWRYASIQELIRIVQAAVLSILIASLITFAVTRLDDVPRMVPIVGCVLMVLMMTSTRIGYRILKERHIQGMVRSDRGGERVLIVGYSNEASAFLRHLAMQRRPAYHVLGIIDHNSRHLGQRLDSVKVLGHVDDLVEVVTRLRGSGVTVGKIVVSRSKTEPAAMETLLTSANELALPIYMLPDADLLQSDDLTRITPRAVKLDDLLERPVVDVDLGVVGAFLRDKTIMVTGGGGSIGSGLVEQVLGFFPRRLIILDSSEHNLYIIEQLMREKYPYQDILPMIADVRDEEMMRAIMLQHRPNMVFHAAALKHVPIVEQNPLEGAKTNILGTINVANAAVEAEVAVFVMISTDKAVNPTNVMGATKRFAEAFCQNLDRKPGVVTRFVTVRFGNVLGSSGSVIQLFDRQIAQGGPLTVTHPEIRRYFMAMREAVRLVLTASARCVSNPDERGKIMVLHMGAQVRIVDIAHRMIQLAGLRPGVDIDIVFTGLRPGEKLYEERLAASEQIEQTTESWLQIATPRETELEAVSLAVDSLRTALELRDVPRLLDAIRLLVPELLQLPASQVPPIPAQDKTIVLSEARRRLRPAI